MTSSIKSSTPRISAAVCSGRQKIWLSSYMHLGVFTIVCQIPKPLLIQRCSFYSHFWSPSKSCSMLKSLRHWTSLQILILFSARYKKAKLSYVCRRSTQVTIHLCLSHAASCQGLQEEVSLLYGYTLSLNPSLFLMKSLETRWFPLRKSDSRILLGLTGSTQGQNHIWRAFHLWGR